MTSDSSFIPRIAKIGMANDHLRGGFFPWNFGALCAGFGEADGDGLFATFYDAALASGTRLQRAFFLAAHGALHALASCWSVLTAC
jgi:hypothetical protein